MGEKMVKKEEKVEKGEKWIFLDWEEEVQVATRCRQGEATWG